MLLLQSYKGSYKEILKVLLRVYKEFTPDSPWCAFLEVFYEANMEVTEKSVALLNC